MFNKGQLAGLMKQAQAMQDNLKKAQDELANVEVQAESGAGLAKVTDFNRAAHKQDGETVVFSWVEWPDKETRTKGWEQFMKDERMQHDPEDQTFDGKRMIYGGFEPIVMA